MALHVERLGTGIPLVLLHGWGLHGGVWKGLATRLAPTFALHVVDLPGHGHSREVAFAGLDALADEVASCAPERAIVCGWSLGGLVAMRLARRHPGRCTALALVSTSPCFVRRPDWPHAIPDKTLADFAADLQTDLEKTVRAFVNLNAIGGAQTRACIREVAALILDRGAPSAAALTAGLALLRDTDLRVEAREIEQPTTVIHGGRDVLAPVGAGRWLARNLSRASLMEIPEASHLPFVSHPDLVARTLVDLHG